MYSMSTCISTTITFPFREVNPKEAFQTVSLNREIGVFSKILIHWEMSAMITSETISRINFVNKKYGKNK